MQCEFLNSTLPQIEINWSNGICFLDYMIGGGALNLSVAIETKTIYPFACQLAHNFMSNSSPTAIRSSKWNVRVSHTKKKLFDTSLRIHRPYRLTVQSEILFCCSDFIIFDTQSDNLLPLAESGCLRTNYIRNCTKRIHVLNTKW